MDFRFSRNRRFTTCALRRDRVFICLSFSAASILQTVHQSRGATVPYRNSCIHKCSVSEFAINWVYLFHSSTGSTFNNDDSGFSEPPNPTNNSFENAKTAARNSPTQSGVGGRRLFSTDKVQNNNLIPDGTPVPRSSSTPNRVEIIIDENWDRAREDNENEPYDLNLNDSAIGFYWSDTKDENNNFNERKSGVLQPLQELDNIRLEVDLIDEKAGEAVNPRAFEKENVSNDAPEKESSYSNGDQIPQALCPHTNSETNVLFNIRDAANDAGLNDKPTLAGSKIQSELVKTDFRPLVQIKTELYDDVSDDDVPKFDDIKVKTELVDDVHSTSASDKWAKLNDISENAQLIPETCESKIPKTALDSSNVFEEISGFSNNDYVAPKRKRIGRKTLTPRRSPTKCDPKFKGATVWFQTEYKRGKSQLNISAFYR